MHKDPDVLKSEIDAIQERMKARVEAVSDSFSPTSIVQNTLSRVFEDPTGSFDRAVETVRRHPIASSMLAAGVTALAGAASKDRVARKAEEYGIDEKLASGKRHASNAAKDAQMAANAAGSRIADTASSIKDNVADAGSRLGSKASNVAGSAKQAAIAGVHSVQEGAHAAREKTVDLAHDTKEFAKENPVAVGLLAVAAGALVASVFAAKSNSTPKVSGGTAEPDVSKAKKATRAKSTPNKVVKRMKPATKSASTASRRKTKVKKSPVKRTRTSAARTTTKAGTASTSAAAVRPAPVRKTTPMKKIDTVRKTEKA